MLHNEKRAFIIAWNALNVYQS